MYGCSMASEFLLTEFDKSIIKLFTDHKTTFSKKLSIKFKISRNQAENL